MTDDLLNIIRACQTGDRSAFRLLVERHYAYVHRVAYRVLLNSEDAADAAQEAFVKLWQNIGTFNPAMNFTTWLYKIAANAALDAVRRRKRRSDVEVPNRGVPEGTGAPEHPAEARDMAGIAASLLGSLPPGQRLIIALRDFEDLSVKDVASITGSSTSSVKANLSYARRRLRKLLIGQYGITGTDL